MARYDLQVLNPPLLYAEANPNHRGFTMSEEGQEGQDYQQPLEGAFPAVPQATMAVAEEYADTLQTRMNLQKREKELKGKLIESMKLNDIDFIDTPTKTISLKHEETDKIEVKTKPEEPAE